MYQYINTRKKKRAIYCCFHFIGRKLSQIEVNQFVQAGKTSGFSAKKEKITYTVDTIT